MCEQAIYRDIIQGVQWMPMFIKDTYTYYGHLYLSYIFIIIIEILQKDHPIISGGLRSSLRR